MIWYHNSLIWPAVALQVIEKREEMDWKRHGVFLTFGLVYLVSCSSGIRATASEPYQ
jgi:hypothetical protein